MAAKRYSVRAREHRGASSLDLTIPAAIVKELGIQAGDVFAVAVEKVGAKAVLRYSRLG